MRGCVHGSLSWSEIGPEGRAAIAEALRHVPLLTQLGYAVVRERGMRRRAVWGEAVMVVGLVCRRFLVGGCEVGAIDNAVQCQARGMCLNAYVARG